MPMIVLILILICDFDFDCTSARDATDFEHISVWCHQMSIMNFDILYSQRSRAAWFEGLQSWAGRFFTILHKRTYNSILTRDLWHHTEDCIMRYETILLALKDAVACVYNLMPTLSRRCFNQALKWDHLVQVGYDQHSYGYRDLEGTKVPLTSLPIIAISLSALWFKDRLRIADVLYLRRMVLRIVLAVLYVGCSNSDEQWWPHICIWA